MDIELLSKKYVVRRLDLNDVDAVDCMSCKNEIFYKYHPPFVTKQSIVEDMEALPPHKSYDDKYYIGIFEDNTLVANMDLILGYPTEEIAFIGLLMTNVLYQNKGVGSSIVRDVCAYLKLLGYKNVTKKLVTAAFLPYFIAANSFRLLLLTRLIWRSKSPLLISSARTYCIKVGTVQE